MMMMIVMRDGRREHQSRFHADHDDDYEDDTDGNNDCNDDGQNIYTYVPIHTECDVSVSKLLDFKT